MKEISRRWSFFALRTLNKGDSGKKGCHSAELYRKPAINLNRGYGDYLEKRDEIIRACKELGVRMKYKRRFAAILFLSVRCDLSCKKS
ncbi:MAG: hypothetical protein K6G27_14855 [Lachnospiraceae bacterium]|nr:hypothetical protein [Lachnospiraceae bacterium]